jgi:peptide/nickel transport system permease protein
LAILIPIIALISVVVFLLTSMVPGGAVAALIEGRPTSQGTVEALMAKYHLNEPLIVQYWYWLSGVLRGDFGRSFQSSQLVLDAIRSRVGLTVMLNVIGLTVALLVGIPLGTLAAMRRAGMADRTIVGVSIFGSSTPSFVIALLFLYVFAQKLNWFPLFGAGSGSIPNQLYHLVLPGLVMAVVPTGLIMKITRASMLDQIDLDHIAFARARGLAERRVIFVYGLRNALIPVLTAAGLIFVGLLTGTVFVEYVFGLPGLGGLLVTAVRNSDIPVIQGLVLIVGFWIIIANLLVDLSYAVVDPRVTFGKVAD